MYLFKFELKKIFILKYLKILLLFYLVTEIDTADIPPLEGDGDDEDKARMEEVD